MHDSPRPSLLSGIIKSVALNLRGDGATEFAMELSDAMEGKNLSLVHWAFFADELRKLPEVSSHNKSAINPVLRGFESLASGGDFYNSIHTHNVAIAFSLRASSNLERVPLRVAGFCAKMHELWKCAQMQRGSPNSLEICARLINEANAIELAFKITNMTNGAIAAGIITDKPP